MILRSVFYRKAGDAAWTRVVGAMGSFLAEKLPVEIKYEVDVGDGEVRTVTTKLPTIGSPWSPQMFPGHFSQAYFAQDLEDGPVSSWRPHGVRGHELASGPDQLKLATQADPDQQPTRTSEGVVFAPGSGQHLVMPPEQVAVGLHRWTLVVFKMNTARGTHGQIFTVNGDHRQPALYVEDNKVRSHWKSRVRDFDPITGRPLPAPAGAVRDAPLISDCFNAVLDGSAWNISLSHRRRGRTFSRLNGVPHAAHTDPDMRFNTERRTDQSGYIGPSPAGRSRPDPTKHHGMTLKYLIFGQGELSEKWERKLEAWAAWEVGQQAMLPGDHPYRSVRPLVEADDFENFFVADIGSWAAWKESIRTVNTWSFDRFTNRGKAPPALTGYTRVFLDDFRRFSIADSQYHRTDERANFFAPGWNVAVGGDHANSSPEMIGFHRDDPYRYEMIEWDESRKYLRLTQKWFPENFDRADVPPPEADLPITVPQPTLTEGKGRVTAIYTTDDTGVGRDWKGGYVARARIRFDEIPDIYNRARPSFWAYPWGYSTRTREWWHEHRLEFDSIEPDAADNLYLNGAANHLHDTGMDYIERRQPSFKIVGTKATKENGWPFNLPWWDGKWKTIEIRVDPDLTYISVDIGPDPAVNGAAHSSTDPADRSNMVELFRYPTSPIMMQPFNLILNTCSRNAKVNEWGLGAHFTRATQKLDGNGDRLWLDGSGKERTTDTGTPAREWANYRYWIDWIEVLQRDSLVYPAKPLAPFSLRPTISREGDVLTVDPKIVGLEHIEYIWHVDGYPVGGPPSTTYTLQPDDAGKRIAVLVQAAGYMGRPEAWSDSLLVT